MKEASGEASMTGITIALIAIVAVVATPLITSLIGNTAKRTCCTGAGYQWKSNKCYNGSSVVADNNYWNSQTKECK